LTSWKKAPNNRLDFVYKGSDQTINFAYLDENYEMQAKSFSTKPEAQAWADYQISLFKLRNKVKNEDKDMAFLRYKKEFDDVLKLYS
jgi:hypothetical protein